ncbi:MAG: DUF3800 domain-containing protein [Pseudoclavibacter sp.]
MLIAYLDEFGHQGPYLGDDHPRFNQHPIFGYAGYVIPVQHSRSFGADVKRDKENLFKEEIARSKTPNQWEKKGSEIFTTGAAKKYPQNLRTFEAAVKKLVLRYHGKVFYYGDEKALGTIKTTNRDPKQLQIGALRETVNRLSRYADQTDNDIIVLVDSITLRTQRENAAKLYGHIYARSREVSEMKRMVEAPLSIDSALNSGIQFADWICAYVSRLAHYQFVEYSDFGWTTDLFVEKNHIQNMFTYESKIHSLNGVEIQNEDLLRSKRKRFKSRRMGTVGATNPTLVALRDAMLHQPHASHQSSDDVQA